MVLIFRNEKTMKKLLFAFFVITLSVNLLAQENLTGIFRQDARIAFEQTNFPNPQINYPVVERKSPLLAGVLSFVVPGAGEIYTGQYLKAGIFLALEVAVITTAISYDNKGDKKTIEFQNYADDQWSVVKYAQWLNTHKGANITIDPNIALKPWERVNWEELNAAEAGFSHKLAPYGEQQYYELIGKYPQFSPGWHDFDPADPDYHDVPQQALNYSGERGKANDYYNVASKAVIGIYVNHFLSVLDAVWSAVSFNKDLTMNIRTENIMYAGINELIPVFNLKYSF